MATLDDKLLGEKKENYCSSDEEGERDKDLEKISEKFDNHGNIRGPVEKRKARPRLESWEGSSVNTGPKGVLKDWQRFKQLENEKREESEREKLSLMKKLSLTCSTMKEDEAAKKKEIEEDLENDEFIKEYMRKRMEEMIKIQKEIPIFGKLIHLHTGQQFLDAVENERPTVTVIIHIFTEKSAGCEAMNGSLQCLAEKFTHIKFCTLEASSAGMSRRFEKTGVPALLVYRQNTLIGNFVRLTDEFGEDFFASDVENFLVEHGMLPDQSLVPEIIQQ